MIVMVGMVKVMIVGFGLGGVEKEDGVDDDGYHDDDDHKKMMKMTA